MSKRELLVFKIIFALPGLLFIICAALFLYKSNPGITFYKILAAGAGGMLSLSYILIIFLPKKRNSMTALFFFILGMAAFAAAGYQIYSARQNPPAPAVLNTLK